MPTRKSALKGEPSRMRLKMSHALVAGAGSMFLALLVLAGPAHAWSTSSWTSPWDNTTNNWAPCSGSNTYNLDSPSNGVFSAVVESTSNADVLCSPDTTEHEENAGEHSSQYWSPTTSGYYTLSASFSGTIAVWSSENSCNNGDGHSQLQIGVAAYDTSTGTSVYNWITPSGGSSYNGCGSGGGTFNPGSVSTYQYFYSTHSYQVRAGVDDLAGASQNWQGGTSQGFVGFENVCWVGFGGYTTTTITLNSISIN